MSEQEKIRAITLLSLLGAVLLVLFGLQANNGTLTLPSTDPLRLCAVTHGALCEPVSGPVPTRHVTGTDGIVTLGHITVTAPRLESAPRRLASIV